MLQLLRLYCCFAKFGELIDKHLIAPKWLQGCDSIARSQRSGSPRWPKPPGNASGGDLLARSRLTMQTVVRPLDALMPRCPCRQAMMQQSCAASCSQPANVSESPRC